MTSDRLFLWIVFNIFVLGMLAIDLGVFHRKAHTVAPREATTWCFIWITLGLLFNTGIYLWLGSEPALEFFAGYLIEYSLSVDNIFVFILILSYFAVPGAYQHRVLFWGIFGALLVFTGIKMFTQDETAVHPENNPVIKALRRFMPLSSRYEGQCFFVKLDGRWAATPLFVVLLVVESTDLIFAVDSVPAIFAVSGDPFIVYTSNVFAILGLRSLYFLLAGVMDLFVYLRHGLGFVLGFVGIKMLLVDIYKIPIGASLGVVVGILALSIVASLAVRSGVTDSWRAFRFSFNTSSAGSNQFWIWFAIVGAVLAIIMSVQPGFPLTAFSGAWEQSPRWAGHYSETRD